LKPQWLLKPSESDVESEVLISDVRDQEYKSAVSSVRWKISHGLDIRLYNIVPIISHCQLNRRTKDIFSYFSHTGSMIQAFSIKLLLSRTFS
jgi:hypothetical protein